MLSVTATGSLRRWPRQALPSSTGCKSLAVSQNILGRINISKGTPQTIACRFRHSSSFSGSGKAWGIRQPTTPQSRYQDSYSRSPQGRQFGGQEFIANWEEKALENAIDRFKKPNGVQQHLESLGTPRDKAVELVKGFSAKALRGEVPEVRKKALGMMATESLEAGMTFRTMGVTREEAIASKLDKTLWDAFFAHCETMFPPDTLFRLQRMRDISDLRFPAEWNPAARLMKRKIIMHVGPTNSGKTHNALMRLQSASSGVYLSPLRLLAHEIYERMNKAGTPCNLITGEEKRYAFHDENGAPLPDSAKMLSCTVEMANLNRKVEVAVIDEIQMLADPSRGWAWTQALLGLPAEEIHLCGEPTVVELVKKICAMTNEEVVVNNYDRLSKLEVQDESIYGNFQGIQKGDCVVTFSRKNIFLLKKAIEAETGLRCAVAYGSLPPESRSTQAKLFNDPDSGYDVLVASDAIGMGLNLNIRRIIFEAVEKFDGSVVRNLSITQIKQIAGRAGRFGTEYAVGQATTLVQSDIPILKKALATPMIEIKDAAVLFDNIKMPVRERIPFISAPIQVRDDTVVTAAKKLAKAVGDAKKISIDEVVRLPEKDSRQEKDLDLRKLESSHRVIMLYLWLSQRFGNVIQGGIESDAAKRKTRCEVLIDMALKQAENKKLKKKREAAEKLKNKGQTEADGQKEAMEP
ncbi:RNA helicase [Entomortierella chlamydospora]|uniref:RNA helicase n=1 Tax=Entomortierella chlamydospora TaxID=101097 RepID=A0A9P6N3A2_9FUNG|nr:RNA helicase [Entomortierella chlamydospora]